MNTNKIDLVTVDIVKDALLAISDEVFHVLARTSMSPIIYEVLDYASGISDADGNLLTQGNGVTGFIGMLSPMIADTIKKHGKKNMKPGDVFLINDPYMGGGSHPSDVGMVMPIFYNGEIIAFAANKAHWTEVGGMAAGSFTTDAKEIYQEGLRFSCIKLVDAGEIIESVVDIIRSNVRFPEMSLGDMWGQISALRVGFKRIGELCDKYSVDTVKASMERLLSQGEAAAKQCLKALKKGVYEMEDYMDDDGYGNIVKLRVKVTISDDEFIVDFTGSSPQVASPINTGYSSLCAGVKVVYMSILNPEMSVNDGVFKSLKVIAEEGSIFNCTPPAPTSTYYESMLYATDLIWHALANTFPDRLTAGHYLSVCSVVLAGIHQDSGEPFLVVEPTCGGWGAGAGKDGEVGQFCVANGETYNVPVEIAETRYGILVNEYSLRTDGAGAGQYRGGSGALRVYKALSDGQLFTASFGRFKSPVWGINGGGDGSHNFFEIIRADGSKEEPCGIAARIVLNKGDEAHLYTASGGGYGPALRRPAAKVASDVKNGYISLAQAESDYGVLLDGNFEIAGYTDKRKNSEGSV
jgi:N-methylhydantoinase B